MANDPRINGLKEKLRYLQEEVDLVHSSDVKIRRKAALNVGAWIYALEQLARRFKDLDRADFSIVVQPTIETFCGDLTIDWWLTIRHKVIHDTPPSFISSTHISYLDSNMINQINQSAPQGTIGTFFGDELGGSGWEVAGEKEEIRKVYFSLPSSIGSTEVNFPDPPDHKGIENLADEALKLTHTFVNKVIVWIESRQSILT